MVGGGENSDSLLTVGKIRIEKKVVTESCQDILKGGAFRGCPSMPKNTFIRIVPLLSTR